MNLMEEMRKKYYPYHEQTKNLVETLDMIKAAMQRGWSSIEVWSSWSDLPDDWVVEKDTLDKLKEQGFAIIKSLGHLVYLGMNGLI